MRSRQSLLAVSKARGGVMVLSGICIGRYHILSLTVRCESGATSWLILSDTNRSIRNKYRTPEPYVDSSAQRIRYNQSMSVVIRDREHGHTGISH